MAHIDDEQTQKANLDYIRKAMDAPMLEKDHELALATRWKEDRDEKALHELINSYTRLVIAMASKFKNYGLPIGDLIQEGNIGLMQASEKFDPTRDIRFSTYASWWIRSSIQDYVLRNWSIVRTGTTAAQKSLFFNMRRLRAKIENRDEKATLNQKNRKEIAEELGVSLKDVEMMESRIFGNDQSLNATLKDEEGADEWQSFLADERPNPEDVVVGMRDMETRSNWLKSALGELSEREQKIIHDRHLVYDTLTLEELGNQLGVSKERVRQLESRAMEKLKTSLGKHVTDSRDILVDV
ncbi:MAG: RNA polymerase factor sigma-32 [Alphaproteobacteria bacterium]|jgi:RNA polymerase sigma-32 factor|nr:RNA polymerase factor sigma-32 [Alphaproteobacteria bacterium]MDP7222474.1 RNA polymerase factor sigma-32 [Alphaproteobacteria bacterium]